MSGAEFIVFQRPYVSCSQLNFLEYMDSGVGGVAKWTKDVDIFQKDFIIVPIHHK